MSTSQRALEIALEHHEAGRLAEAEAIYRRILAAEPNHADALHYLGILALGVGRDDLAIELIQRGLLLQPHDVKALSNLGEAYRRMGRRDEAIDTLKLALEIQPNFPEALNNLGAALTERGDNEEAVVVLRRAVELSPQYACGFRNLGLTLMQLEQWDEAIAACRHAVQLNPRAAEAHNNLGLVLSRRGRGEEAIAAFRSAVQCNPGIAESHENLGKALAAEGRMEEALDGYRQALALQPDSPAYHWNAALALLSLGRLREGWEHFEWRVRTPQLARPDLTVPPWNGEDLAGRTLLIHQEGGFGDVIQFLRYVPMIHARGAGRVVFEGLPAILPLMQLQPGIDGKIPTGSPLPAHDFHCPPQSFPRIFGTELHNIPADVPYLLVDAEKTATWRRKLAEASREDAGEQPPFLVGLCWAGSPQPVEYRSRTLGTLAPLFKIPGITFVSLQKGPDAEQSKTIPAGVKFVNAAAEAQDFSDLAALVSGLDMVISVDTSIAHLAAALGVTTWILIPKCSDFRWLIGRTDSPWYPTARLFRQQVAGNWDAPIEEMVEALSHHPKGTLAAAMRPR